MPTHPDFAKNALFCLLVTAVPFLAVADSPAERALHSREDLMKDMGKHMKALRKALGDGMDAKGVAEHAEGIATLTKTLASDLKSLFPVGSDQGETEARPLIWKQWDQFNQAAQSAATKGAALLNASTHGQAADLQPAYQALGETCKTCHKEYRAEK